MKSGDAAIPPQHAAILRVIRSIPRGRVTSYGEVAARAGLPGRARMIGRILGEYSALKLPWQRVLRAGGHIAFPAGSRGYREQRALLIDEGVAVRDGRVDLARFGWQRNLDAELWAPE
jgi:methylated-DNA-protein-cysteine methyltransferase-like protein